MRESSREDKTGTVLELSLDVMCKGRFDEHAIDKNKIRINKKNASNFEHLYKKKIVHVIIVEFKGFPANFGKYILGSST